MKKNTVGFLMLLAICIGCIAFVRCSNNTEGFMNEINKIEFP